MKTLQELKKMASRNSQEIFNLERYINGDKIVGYLLIGSKILV